MDTVFLKQDKDWKKTLEYSNDKRTPWTTVVEQPQLNVEDVKNWCIEKVDKFLYDK